MGCGELLLVLEEIPNVMQSAGVDGIFHKMQLHQLPLLQALVGKVHPLGRYAVLALKAREKQSTPLPKNTKTKMQLSEDLIDVSR